MNKVLVVGGGPAGMMAAISAARGGAEVLLLERNEKLGKKLYITGKGRCNLTNNAETVDKFMRNVPRNPKFLHASLAALSPARLMDMVEEMGVPLKVERGERVFPQSEKASDITRALAREMERAGAQVRHHARVMSLNVHDGQIRGVTLEDGSSLSADRVILATGGKSYPVTGSTGDGYALASVAGHPILDTSPSLVPLEVSEDWPRRLSGLTLKNVTLYADWGQKKRYSQMGEMLFTHFGVSGPLVLTLSAYLPALWQPGDVRLKIDLKPALDEGTLDKRLVREFADAQRSQLITAMSALAPRALAQEIVTLAGYDPAQSISSVTQAQRKALVRLIKGLPLMPVRLRGMDEAVVTRGGVDVRSVHPSTMQSRVVKGLYLCGELLDVDALTGGFNLHIAFATGYLAGKSAAQGED